MEETSPFNNPELYARPGCLLGANGMGFEPKAFLQKTTFDSKFRLHHGKFSLHVQLKSKVAEAEQKGLSPFETGYLLLKVSEAVQSEVQLVETIAFLEQYQAEIKRLREFPGVETVSLRFQPAEGEPNLETLPDEFVELADDIQLIMM